MKQYLPGHDINCQTVSTLNSSHVLVPCSGKTDCMHQGIQRLCCLEFYILSQSPKGEKCQTKSTTYIQHQFICAEVDNSKPLLYSTKKSTGYWGSFGISLSSVYDVAWWKSSEWFQSWLHSHWFVGLFQVWHLTSWEIGSSSQYM